ncbi:Putative peptidase S8/S53 domain, tetratricopeptide-like helical domain superfamily [Colletotrichum destructivum]|uniref:Peptidase S8/S53 domain, tetratricopeptide-like helical domain superfamily n=1 Tax=Colletotrichum destructivum TaxID=34406 RepID=A0AAX4I619_9PEZI|nr:Putative peptidase S8/S53 domain, tetratricopeptide-like helical domain superfamily [Colletotrichum destructivum]
MWPTQAGNGDTQQPPFLRHHVHHGQPSSSNQPGPSTNGSTFETGSRNEPGLSTNISEDQMLRGRSAEPTLRASDKSPEHSSLENRTNLSLQDFNRAINEAAGIKENEPNRAAELILDAMLWDVVKKLPRDDPGVVVAWHHLGECFFRMGNHGEAERFYRQVFQARRSQQPPNSSMILQVRQDLTASLIAIAIGEETRDVARSDKLYFEALSFALENMNEEEANDKRDDDIDDVLHCTKALLKSQVRKPLELAKLNRIRVQALVQIEDDMEDHELLDMQYHGIVAIKHFTVDLEDRKSGYEVYDTVQSRIREYGAQDPDQSETAVCIGEEVEDEWRKATGLLARKRWRRCLEQVRAEVRRDVLPRKKEIRDRWHLICRRLMAKQRWQRVLSEARKTAKRNITCRRKLVIDQWNSTVREALQRKKDEDENRKKEEERKRLEEEDRKRKIEEDRKRKRDEEKKALERKEEKRKREIEEKEERKRYEEKKRLEEEEEKRRDDETRLKRLDEEREQKIRKDFEDKRREEEEHARKREREAEEEEALKREINMQKDLEIQQGISRTDTGYSEWSEPETPMHLDTEPAFFDSESILSSIQNSERWMRDFIRSRNTILSPQHDKNMERVRVTIIDTGLDKTHPFVIKRRWQDSRQAANKKVALFQDFVTENPSAEAIDEDGHGTFIAGIVLQLAPLVELSIARVATTRASLMKDPDAEGKVTKAIIHAITEWDTDIISMSFGFRTYKTQQFRAAIGRANWENKILFAAAGNFGNSKANVSFPARFPGVFKIFATDHQGGKCSFSPSPDLEKSYCFSILGHDVVSIWPEAMRDKDGETQLKVVDKKKSPGLWVAMSGTSFATPIAASVVAILYQFYDANKAEINLEPGLDFKTVDAVRAILLKISMAPTADQHNYLNPWVGRDNYFNFSGEEKNGSVSFFAQMLRLCLGAWVK